MSHYSVPVVDQESAINTPIALQVLREVRAKWFYDTDVEILFTDFTGNRHTLGSREGDKADVVLAATSKIEASLTTRTKDADAYANNPNAFSGPAIWSDKDIPAEVFLSGYLTEFKITLKYTAKSRSEINLWLNQYHGRIGSGLGSVHTPLSYEVYVPDAIPFTIKSIWSLWKETGGTDLEFLDYMGSKFKTPYHVQQAPNNKQSRRLVLTETVENVAVGVPTELPEAVKTDGGQWEVELPLEFSCSVPSMFLCRYSNFVGNKLLPDSLVDYSKDRNKVQRRSFSNGNQHEIILGYLLDKAATPTYSEFAYIYPPFDDVTVSTPSTVHPVLQVRIIPDVDNPKRVINLNTLEVDIGVKVHPDLVEFLRSRGSTAYITGEALFGIGLARDGALLTPRYSIDDDGWLVSDYDLDMRGNYHVLISIKSDLPMLSHTESEAAFAYGDLFNAAVIHNYPTLPTELLPAIESDGQVSREDVLELSKYITTKYRSPNAQTYTASTLIVEA